VGVADEEVGVEGCEVEWDMSYAVGAVDCVGVSFFSLHGKRNVCPLDYLS